MKVLARFQHIINRVYHKGPERVPKGLFGGTDAITVYRMGTKRVQEGYQKAFLEEHGTHRGGRPKATPCCSKKAF